MTSGRYILDADHKVVPCEDLMTWARWFEDITKRRVAWTTLPGGVRVSTVFLGLDHSFGDEATPVVFETMILGQNNDEYQERFCTWDEAVAGHEEAVRVAKERSSGAAAEALP